MASLAGPSSEDRGSLRLEDPKTWSLTDMGSRHGKTSYLGIWSTLSQHRAGNQEKRRAPWSCKTNRASPAHSTLIANLKSETVPH